MIYGTIIRNQTKTVISAVEGETLLSALSRAGFAVHSPCGGNGTCGKCRVKASGALSGKREGDAYFACKTTVEGDFTVFIEEDTLRAQTSYRSVAYTPFPAVRAERTEEKASFYIDGELIAEDAPDARNLGLAVDIGTTTAAVYLCDLDAGRVLGSRGFTNPQRAWGADVISRIDKIMKNKDVLREQQTRILSAINEEVGVLLDAVGASCRELRAAVFCGNTVMQHIAAGLDPSGIAVAPFVPKTLFGEWYDASRVGLLASDGAKIYFAPCVASYVGGDITCGVIAAGLDQTDKNVLYLDIGTNGEIGLATPSGLYFCSAAAGPAFEGAHIECGMPGTSGAVSEIFTEGDQIRFHTINGEAPVGICGSGILDGVSVMLETGILDETGCMDEESDSPYLRENEEDTVFFLADKVYLTGKDIREVQLAKAAIAAGIRTLLREAGLTLSEIDTLVLAGGFGSHIRPESARRVGLIPDLKSVVSVGNTAGAGAVALLLGREPREAAKTILERSHYTELSLNSHFMEAYIEEMEFPEI